FEAGDEQRRILAVDDGNRTRLALLPVFFRDDRAVPALMIELDRDLRSTMHLHAVDRCVDPAVLRITHDHKRTRADERSAVFTMPIRGWELCQIDIAVAKRVFEER